MIDYLFVEDAVRNAASEDGQEKVRRALNTMYNESTDDLSPGMSNDEASSHDADSLNQLTMRGNVRPSSPQTAWDDSGFQGLEPPKGG